MTWGTKILEERRSSINGKIRVLKTLGLGTYIQVEGLTQSGGVVEDIWNSTLKRINKLTIQPINSCLILGLGGGTAARVIKKLWTEVKITGVEIDPMMVELGKRYLGLEASRAKIVIADAFEYVSAIPDTRYDLLIVDTYVGDKIPTKLESENYIHLVRRLLSRSGVAIFNRLYYGNKRSQAVRFGEKLKKVFPKVESFYPEANLMFLCYN